jgi:energy-coupling factor transporter ATP-binding protein EcfA2
MLAPPLMPTPPRRPRLSRNVRPPALPAPRARISRRPPPRDVEGPAPRDPIPGVDAGEAQSRPKLVRVREGDSANLDGMTLNPRGEDPAPMPEFVRWPDFYQYMQANWTAGEHMALVGQTGSGKTTLMRELIDIRDYVVVVATKPADASLYDPLIAKGYKLVDEFDPENIEDPKVIFRPTLGGITQEDEEKQREAIRRALMGVYQTGGWCIALDEIRYLSEQLRLVRELNLLWLQGRSLGVTMVAGTQRPVSVPLNMFEQASVHLSFRIPGREDRKRAAEFTGAMAGVAMETTSRLPRHEFLMIDSVDDEIMRSRVEL